MISFTNLFSPPPTPATVGTAPLLTVSWITVQNNVPFEESFDA